MNVKNVRDAVIALGYSYGLEGNDGLFKYALESAVKEINQIRPRTGTVVIAHELYNPVSANTAIETYTPGQSLTFSCVARSAIFEVDGEGTVTVTRGKIDGKTEYRWNTGTEWKRIFALSDPVSSEEKTEEDGEIKLTFEGETTYHVRNVSFYDVVGTIGLKYGEYIDYNLSDLATDFAEVQHVLRDNVEYSGYRLIDGNHLQLPADDTGTYEVFYSKSVSVSADNDSAKIPLADDLAQLLPLLVASYVWVEDNSDIAQYYRALYTKQAASIKPERVNVRMFDSRGWS